MNNPEKYTYNLTASDCELSMMSVGGTKTIRMERDDLELPFILVLNTAGDTPESSNNNKLFQFKNAKVTVKIEADVVD
jgi:hypothetical protein